MIISASRRTDIPCYYSEWFMNRIREGYVLTRNPMNNAQLSHIQLSPDVVDCIVFWTKDAYNILPYLDELNNCGYKYYFQFTITPYDNMMEQNLRSKVEIEDTFIKLSNMIGSERVVWRYDPIILNDMINIEYHKEQFERMCEKLSPYTDTVTISFVDMYKKLTTANIPTPLIRSVSESEIADIAGYIGVTAKEYSLHAVACCESVDLSVFGIGKSSCIDRTRIENICGFPLDVTCDKNQRIGCGCCQSIDIGAYNTCMNGCVYCYANNSLATTKRRYESHNPNSELLIGSVNPDEKIIYRKVKSDKQNQIYII